MAQEVKPGKGRESAPANPQTKSAQSSTKRVTKTRESEAKRVTRGK